MIVRILDSNNLFYFKCFWIDILIMLLIDTYIDRSLISGLGAFAAKSIAQGDIIWKLDTRFDKMIDKSLLKGLPKSMIDFILTYGYPDHISEDIIIIDSDNSRFMNHSESPNTDFSSSIRGYAIHDIEAGEELTCNYGEFESNTKIPFRWKDLLTAVSV